MNQYYKHFKGNIYKVLHVAKHSETLEDFIVYQAMYGEQIPPHPLPKKHLYLRNQSLISRQPFDVM